MRSLILPLLAAATPAAAIVFPDANIFAQLPIEEDQVATTVDGDSYFSKLGFPELPKAPSLGDVVDGIKKPFKHIAETLPDKDSFDYIVGKAIETDEEWVHKHFDQSTEEDEFGYDNHGLRSDWVDGAQEHGLNVMNDVGHEKHHHRHHHEDGHLDESGMDWPRPPWGRHEEPPPPKEGPPPPPPEHGPPPPPPPPKGPPGHPGHGPPRRGPPHHCKKDKHKGPPYYPLHKYNETIYEIISKSNYTKNFTALIEDDSDLVSLLNSTKVNSTVFVPVDWAFKRIPPHHPKPPKSVITSILKYHILNGTYPAVRLLFSKTAPTLYEPPNLGGPQRVSVGLSWKGVVANLGTRIIAPNLFAKNGVIHGIASLLLPPPPARIILNAFPGGFSTLSLALERVGFTPYLNSTAYPHPGGTLFAPTNGAFSLLGPRINAFLFSPYGKRYLKALLEYHIVPNITVYSTAYYNGTAADSEEESQAVYSFLGRLDQQLKKSTEGTFDIRPAELSTDSEDEETESRVPFWDGWFGKKPEEHHHHHKKGPLKFFRLPTLLSNHSLPVLVYRRGPIVFMKVNRNALVVVQDGLAADGVIHVVNKVLIPPHRHHHHHHGKEEEPDNFDEVDDYSTENMGLDEFKARMEPYLAAGDVNRTGCGGKKVKSEKMRLEF